MAKNNPRYAATRKINRLIGRKNNRVHPLVKLLRYRHFRSFSFLLTLIIALGSYINSNFFEEDKATIIKYYYQFKFKLGLGHNIVNITGLSQLTEKQILDQLSEEYNSSLMSLDINAIKHKLEGMPWIQEANVQRILPNTLNIKIIENIPIALLQKNKRFYLVNDRGEVIMETNNSQNKLIVLTGNKSEKNFPELTKALKEFPEIKIRIKAASFVSERRWDIFLTILGGETIRVQLPQEDIERALQDLQKVMDDSSVELKSIDIVDVRQEGKVYLKYKIIAKESKDNVVI